MEQARGLAGNNIVTVLMRENRISLQEASDRISAHFGALMGTFMRAKAELGLRSFGTPALDAAVARYVGAMEHWVVGNLDWSFETQRYFGPAVKRVKETKVVVLQPRINYGSEDSDKEEHTAEEQVIEA